MEIFSPCISPKGQKEKEIILFLSLGLAYQANYLQSFSHLPKLYAFMIKIHKEQKELSLLNKENLKPYT